jgi:IclR family transcriptional regulator, pca regulon regulatory protein
MKMTEEAHGFTIRSLVRGLRVLQAFDGATNQLSLTEIATLVDLPLPTASRIARTLEEEGFLERDEQGAFRLGPVLLRLAAVVREGTDLLPVARGPLQKLADNTNETTNLSVLDGTRILYLLRIRNADLVTADIRVGSTLPASCTSMGKLLLALLPDERLSVRLPELDFTAGRGPRAIRNQHRFRDEIRQIRQQGWALQDEELELGLRSVAAPIRAGAKAVAAINLAVPAGRWATDELIRHFLPEVIATAQEISAELSTRAYGNRP